MDESGQILEEFPFTNNWDGIQVLVEKTGENYRAVIESTGNLWLRIYEVLEENGVEVKLANPAKTKAIASARIKTDKLSAGGPPPRSFLRLAYSFWFKFLCCFKSPLCYFFLYSIIGFLDILCCIE